MGNLPEIKNILSYLNRYQYVQFESCKSDLLEIKQKSPKDLP